MTRNRKKKSVLTPPSMPRNFAAAAAWAELADRPHIEKVNRFIAPVAREADE